MSFSSFDLQPSLLRALEEMGFTTPTPIQTKALPPALAGRDLLACAMTGSGKTAAFLLPILQRLSAAGAGRPRATRALVLAPTRELAAQIVEHFQALAKHTGLRAAAVYGGVGMGPQERAFRDGVDVIVACPGRLLDHFQQPYARLDKLEVLVLDEADRMLDMGFLPDIRRVLAHIPKVQQTLMFSATVPPQIGDLARQLLRDPVQLDVARPAAPATGVDQAVFPVKEELKPALLVELLKGKAIGNAIVFTRTKHRANRLTEWLDRHGVPAARVHGNRSQAARDEALAGFKQGRYRVLVATDVAARGIDIEALTHVVNFDVPNVPEDYIHRVGRTARAGATGEAFTLFSPAEQGELRAIERAVGRTLPRRTLAGFDYEARPTERFEIPIGERIAEIRARKAEERARAKANAERRAARAAGGGNAGGGHQPARTPAHGPGRTAAHAPAGRRHDGGRPAAPPHGHGNPAAPRREGTGSPATPSAPAQGQRPAARPAGGPGPNRDRGTVNPWPGRRGGWGSR